jgi:transposase-like protein
LLGTEGGVAGVLRELSVVEQRYQAILAVVDDGLSVTDVAAKVGVSRQTLHAWLRRYAARGAAAAACAVGAGRAGSPAPFARAPIRSSLRWWMACGRPSRRRSAGVLRSEVRRDRAAVPNRFAGGLTNRLDNGLDALEVEVPDR